VVLVTERFRELAEATRRSRGMAEAPSVVLPPTEETEYGGKDTMDEIAERALRAVVAVLAPGAARRGAG
jgi:hypothetical protein